MGSTVKVNISALLDQLTGADFAAGITTTIPLPSGELALDVHPDAVHWRHSMGVGGIQHLSITDPAQILSIVKSFSNSEPRPDFYPWVSALDAFGLAASVEPSDGRGFQIHVEGPDGTYLLIGCPVDLPGFAEVPHGFHAEHFSSDGDHIDVVYHSFRDAEGEGEGDSSASALATAVSRYLSSAKTV
ncbi:hypothetical protein OHU25_41085 [Streptomyces sp. NBC_00117]|uniref:hypothetical protein n=1 Tax=Streptomyces sp. NBC_00117 TaxID=2975657 RepID=UPI003254F981